MSQLIVPLDSDILLPMTAVEAEACIVEITTSHQHTGEKLLELHDRAGWKAVGYASWRECVKARFSSFGQSRAYQLLAAEGVRRNIAPVVKENSTTVEKPRKQNSTTVEKPIPESHLRPLTKLEPGEQREVWKEVTSQPGPVTAKRVKRTVGVRQRAQAAIRGTPMQSHHDAVRLLMQYHKLQGEEVFQGVLDLVATGEYDTPQKARQAYKAGAGRDPPPTVQAPAKVAKPPPVLPHDTVLPCPTCGCRRAACRQ